MLFFDEHKRVDLKTGNQGVEAGKWVKGCFCVYTPLSMKLQTSKIWPVVLV